MTSLDLGIIGNCSFGALVDPRGRIVWACLPRFDSDPIFCSLLNGGRSEDDEPEHGFYDIELLDFSHAEQNYRRNSAVLETRLFDNSGGAVEIVDFAPRLKQFERVFRPLMLVRQPGGFAALQRAINLSVPAELSIVLSSRTRFEPVAPD